MSNWKLKLETLWIRFRTILWVVFLLSCIGGVLFGFYLIALALQYEIAHELTVLGMEFTPTEVGNVLLYADDQVAIVGTVLVVVFIGIVAKLTGGFSSRPFWV